MEDLRVAGFEPSVHAVEHSAETEQSEHGLASCSRHGHAQELVRELLRCRLRDCSRSLLMTAFHELTCPFHAFSFRSYPAWVEEEWKSRRSWWPAFHFSFFWAKSDWKADTGLACEKAFVAGILLGKGLWFLLCLFGCSRS